VAEVTNESIKMLIDSHTHVDHIGGSQQLKNIPNLKILANKHTVQFLVEKMTHDASFRQKLILEIMS